MTKFILVGGHRTRGGDGGHSLAKEITSGFDETVKILIVLFAREHARWNKSFQEDQAFFARTLPDTEIELQLAQVETFAEQVRWADAVFLKGGVSTPMIMDALTQDSSWQQYLEGKTVAGSSCGAYVLCRYFSQLEGHLLGPGLGLLPYKILSHWQSPDYGDTAYWAKIYSELDNFGDKLPIIALREGEYRVIRTDKI